MPHYETSISIGIDADSPAEAVGQMLARVREADDLCWHVTDIGTGSTYMVDRENDEVKEWAPVPDRPHGIYPLLVGAVRYALGRSSYVTSETCSIVQSYWPHLQVGERATLLRDVSEALARGESNGETLGMDMDHERWKKLTLWMKENP